MNLGAPLITGIEGTPGGVGLQSLSHGRHHGRLSFSGQGYCHHDISLSLDIDYCLGKFQSSLRSQLKFLYLRVPRLFHL